MKLLTETVRTAVVEKNQEAKGQLPKVKHHLQRTKRGIRRKLHCGPISENKGTIPKMA